MESPEARVEPTPGLGEGVAGKGLLGRGCWEGEAGRCI